MINSTINQHPIAILTIVIFFILILLLPLLPVPTASEAIPTVHSVGGVAVAESPDVVLERPLVLKIGATNTKPELAAVLLVGAPVASDGEELGALAAGEGLGAVLALVVGLQGAEVLQGSGQRMRYVVPAPLRAAVAWQPHH